MDEAYRCPDCGKKLPDYVEQEQLCDECHKASCMSCAEMAESLGLPDEE